MNIVLFSSHATTKAMHWLCQGIGHMGYSAQGWVMGVTDSHIWKLGTGQDNKQVMNPNPLQPQRQIYPWVKENEEDERRKANQVV